MGRQQFLQACNCRHLPIAPAIVSSLCQKLVHRSSDFARSTRALDRVAELIRVPWR